MIETVDVDADIAAWMQDYRLKSEILMSGKKIIPVTMYKDLAFDSNKSSGKQMLIYLGKGTAKGVSISKEERFELFNLIHKTPDFCFGRKGAWAKDFNDRFYNKKVAFPNLGDKKRKFIHENNDR